MSSSSDHPRLTFSPAQQRLWQIEKICGRRSRANPILCLGWNPQPGEGDKVLFNRCRPAIAALLADYPLLSARLVQQGECPRWQLPDGSPVTADIQHCEQTFAECIESEHLASFDLENEPPCRFYGLQERDHRLIVAVFHPLVMCESTLDGVFARLEEHIQQTNPANQVGLTVPSGHPQEISEVLAKAATLQAFPEDFPREPIKHFDCNRLNFVLKEKHSDDRQLLLQRVIATMALVVTRYSLQSTAVFGIRELGGGAVLAPPGKILEDLRPLALELDGVHREDELCNRIQRQLTVARQSMHLPLDGELATLGTNNMSFVPVAQHAISFVHQQAASPQARFERIYPQLPERTLSHSDLELRVNVSPGGRCECTLVYAIHLFTRERMERMVSHMQALFNKLCASQGLDLDSIDILSSSEHTELKRLNTTERALKSVRIDAAILQQCQMQGQKIAVLEGRRTLSYEQLACHSQTVARGLRGRGVVAGARVGVHMKRSTELVVCVLALLRCGAVYVPLDRQYPRLRIDAIVEQYNLSLVITDGDCSHSGGAAPFIDWALLLDAGNGEAQQKAVCEGGTAEAYLMFTSGSTHQPKGVLASHASVINRVQWAQSAMSADEQSVYCLKTRLAFVDHISELFQPLMLGAKLVIADDDTVLDAKGFSLHCQQQGVTHLTLIPSYLELLVREGALTSMQGLKVLCCSGEPLWFGLVRQVARQLPELRIFNIYGLTEAGADSLAYEIPLQRDLSLEELFSQTEQSTLPALDEQEEETYTRPGVTLEALAEHFCDTSMPTTAMSVEQYRHWLHEKVLPYTVNVASGRYVGHMTSALPGFMAEISSLVSQMNQNMVKVETSKALTLLERQLIAIFHREFFGQVDYSAQAQDPSCVFGLVASGGSSANITAMWNARNCALMAAGLSKAEIDHLGAYGALQQVGYKRFAIVTSRLAHYSIRKAVALMGLGEDNLITLKQMRDQRADVDHLRETLRRCRDDHTLVIAVIGIAGATETGTLDPIDAMGQVAAEYGVHFHVDAAWGGAMVFSQKHRSLLAGIERADTLTLCPHKQLYVPQGISLCLFRDPEAVHASAVHAVYQGQKGSFDMGQYTIEGSRPAIFLSLHAMLCMLAKPGIGDLIDKGIEKTAYFADIIDRHPAFQLIGQPSINILNYRYIPKDLRNKSYFTDAENERLNRAVADIQHYQFMGGKTFVSKTRILNRHYAKMPIAVFRVVIANPLTRHQDLIDTLENQLYIAEQQVENKPMQTGRSHIFHPQRLAAMDRYQVPVGHPIDNTEVFIVDARGRLLPAGIEGEIAIGGVGVALELLDGHSDGDSHFPHPYEEGKKLFRTGDYGIYRVDGDFEYRGRRDANVKIRGMRMNLNEIEYHCRNLETVRECAVLLHKGDDDLLVHAFICFHREQEFDHECERLMRRQLLKLLPVSMMPAVFHSLPSLPRTASGKVDRVALINSLSHSATSSPRVLTETQQRLVAMWQGILNRQDVHPDDNFFEIGGHSISAATLHQQVKTEFSLDLGLHTFFEFPKLFQLAEIIDGELEPVSVNIL